MPDTRTGRAGRVPTHVLSEWSLRRKVALAVAIPMVLAGILGGLRVHSDLTEAENFSASAKQVTVLRPAVAYLAAAERAAVVARQKTTVATPSEIPPSRRSRLRPRNWSGLATAQTSPPPSAPRSTTFCASASSCAAGTATSASVSRPPRSASSTAG